MNWRNQWSVAILLMAGAVSAGCTTSLFKTTAQEQPPRRPAARTGADYPGFRLEAGPRGELSLLFMEKTPAHTGLLLNRSTDYGATWQRPVTISQNPDPRAQMSPPSMQSDATGIALAWRVKKPGSKTIYFTRSKDRGQTWPAEPTALIREGSPFSPGLSANPGSHLYLMWQDEERPVRDLKFMASSDAGSTWPAQPISLTAHLAAKGAHVYDSTFASDQTGRVYVAWHETGVAPSRRIVFTRSADFGQSWLSEPMAIRALTDTTGPRFTSPVLIADTAGHVYLAWNETHSAGSDIYMTRSDDGGTTWPHPPVRLTSVSPGAVTVPQNLQFTVDRAGTLYAIWTEKVDETSQRVAFRRSIDFGRSWEPIQFLDGEDREGRYSESPVIKVDEAGRVYVAWQQWQRGAWGEWRIFFTRSEDHGVTWRREPIRLDTLPQTSARPRLRPLNLLADGEGTVYVTWAGDPFGKVDGFLNRSKDYGVTWLPKEQWLTDPSSLVGHDTSAPTVGPSR